LGFSNDDGGRKADGYKGNADDCATRAIAIATGRTYQEIYDLVDEQGTKERPRRSRKKGSARTGIKKSSIDKILARLGWKWVPTMQIGSGCKVHLLKSELPAGRLIVRVSKHITAVIDGVIHDTYNPSRGGTRCVYGYWRKI